MKRIVRLPALVLCCVLLFLGCQKEINGDVPDLANNTPVNVEGIITDVSGLPLQGVIIKAGTQQVVTDINGSFRAANVVFNTNEFFITAAKPGYFTGSRTFFAKTGSNNFLRIQLLKRIEAATINAANGGTVAVNGTVITFPANAFVTNGTAYTGTVSVKAAYLDPTDPDMNQQMPGDLRGVRINGDLSGLKSFGMINVELESSNGQPLQLKTGISAQISMPIPASLQASSKPSIPLWYFDEATGLWKEEGTAQKVGSRYEGAVSHFTFWNLDEPFQYVLLNMKVVNQAQLPVSGARVELSSVSDSITTYDYTDNNGNINGYVPINVGLRRDIYNECDVLVSSTIIGPFTANADLGNVIINTSANQQTISGTVVNCSNLPVRNGHVIINTGSQTVYANVVNGTFTATFSLCTASSSATIIAIDDSVMVQGNPVSVALNSPIVAAGILTACGASVQEFLTITVNGVSRTWNAAPYDLFAMEDSVQQSGSYEVYLGAYDTINGSGPNILLFRNATATTVPIQAGFIQMDIYDPLAAPSMLGDYFVTNMTNCTFTQYGPVGQFIAGNFSGIFMRNTLQVSDTVTVSASFKMRRE